MTYLSITIFVKNFFFFQNIINMPCGICSCATCHNLGPSLIIKMDDVDQYFEKKFMSKFFHNATCYILIDG
jgi:hypothetical protein